MQSKPSGNTRFTFANGATVTARMSGSSDATSVVSQTVRSTPMAGGKPVQVIVHENLSKTGPGQHVINSSTEILRPGAGQKVVSPSQIKGNVVAILAQAGVANLGDLKELSQTTTFTRGGTRNRFSIERTNGERTKLTFFNGKLVFNDTKPAPSAP